ETPEVPVAETPEVPVAETPEVPVVETTEVTNSDGGSELTMEAPETLALAEALDEEFSDSAPTDV
ncbi:MAG: hypothetical protein ACO2YR_04175, partial [Nitrosopumilaceae archaeon]